MVDRSDVQVDGRHRAERPLDLCECFVAAHRLGRAHLLLRRAGADDIEPIEGRFGGDLLIQPLERKAALLDVEREVLTDFVFVDDFADPHSDLVTPGERAVLDAPLNLLQFPLARCEQRLALVSP